MKMQTLLATCFAVAGALQLAAAAPGAAAGTLTADVLRTNQGGAVVDAGAVDVDASVLQAAAGAADGTADGALKLGLQAVDDGGRYRILYVESRARPPKCVMADGARAADKRDDASSYVYATTTESYTDGSVFTALLDQDTGMYLFQYNDPHGGKPRYLGAHKNYDSDVTEAGNVRLIVHEDRDKAALWHLFRNGTFLWELVLMINQDPTGADAGIEHMGVAAAPAASDGTQELVVNDDHNDVATLFFEGVYVKQN